MSAVFRLLFFCGVAAIGLFAASAVWTAEKSANDLTPILPRTRMLITNDENDGPYPFRGFGNSASLSTDGRWLLLSGNNNTVMTLWDLRAPHPSHPRLFRIDSSGNGIGVSALSPDGKTAALASSQEGNNDLSIHFLATDTGKPVRDIDNDQPIFGLAFSPDGRLLAVGTQQRIELWKAEDGEEFRLFSSAQNANYRLLTFSPDGRMLAAVGMEPDVVHIWEVASAKERTAIHQFGVQTNPAAGGGRAAMMAGMRVRMMMGGMGGPLGEGYGNGESIFALAFSADSRLLAVSKQDSSIHLWDLQTNRELPPLTGFRGQVNALAFSADGKELTGVNTEGTLLTWRMASLRRNNNVRLVALDDADFAELWNDLAEADAFRIYRARRHLVADADRAVPLLGRHLEPVPPGDAARIEQLLKDLTSSNGGKRRKAMTELRTKHGEAALGALLQKHGGNAGAAGGLPGLMQAIAGGMAMPGGGDAPPAILLLMQKPQTKYHTPERQRDLAAVRVLEEIGTPQAKEVLTKLSKGAAGVSLTTEAKSALTRLSAVKQKAQPATTEALWKDLSGDDAARAFRAMRRLCVSPKETVSYLGERLKPVPVVEEKELTPLLANLEADDYHTRQQASAALEKAGEQAVPLLKQALERKPALEARKRIEQLLDRLTQQTPASVLQTLRAVEVLEYIGGDDAKNVLRSLSSGAPKALVTREAKASLQRLAHR